MLIYRIQVNYTLIICKNAMTFQTLMATKKELTHVNKQLVIPDLIRNPIAQRCTVGC